MKKTLGKLPDSAFGLLTLPRLPATVLEGFRALEDLTGTTSDAMDELGIVGAVPGSALRPSNPKARVVAQAVTILNRRRKEPVPKAVKSGISGLGEIEAHHLAEPGDILVIQGIAGISSMGGVSASVGKRQQEAGAIVDGAVRDIDHSRSIGYPVWSSSVSPVTGKWRIRTMAINKPVKICGVAVRAGDLVVADECGVCFVPYQRAAEVLKVAQQLAVSEKKRLDRLATGITVAEFSAIPRKS